MLFRSRLVVDVPRQIDDEATSVIVDGPFDQATAMAIQNNAKFNYYKMRK